MMSWKRSRREFNPDPTKMREPCAILGQPFQRSPTFWSQARSYTMGELSTLRGPQGRECVEPVYGTNSSGAPFDAR